MKGKKMNKREKEKERISFEKFLEEKVDKVLEERIPVIEAVIKKTIEREIKKARPFEPLVQKNRQKTLHTTFDEEFLIFCAAAALRHNIDAAEVVRRIIRILGYKNPTFIGQKFIGNINIRIVELCSKFDRR
jgi:hypothetical protein